MLAKEAIAQAKALVQDFYADEELSGIRLEEVEFDEASDSWLITLGILRPTVEKTQSKFMVDALHADINGRALARTYKVLMIPNDVSNSPSMKMRELRVDE